MPGLVAGQEAKAQSASASFGVAFPSDTTTGNLIVASSAVWEDSIDILSAEITDSKSNLYIIASSAEHDGGAYSSRIELQYAYNITGGPTTVSSNDLGSDTFRSLIISEWEGVRSTSDPLDVDINGANGDSTAPNSGPITPAGSALYIACGGYEGLATVTAGGGYTKLTTEVTSDFYAPQYVLYNTGSGEKTAQSSLSVSLGWTLASAAFLEPSITKSKIIAPFIPPIVDFVFRVPKLVDGDPIHDIDAKINIYGLKVKK